MTNSGDQLDTSALYSHNPEWKDVTPIKFTEDELGAVRIAANEQCKYSKIHEIFLNSFRCIFLSSSCYAKPRDV